MKTLTDKTKVKISVIVPVYNCEDFLERCIKSLLAQTMKDWEAIFVNDGSSDSSEEIIYRFAQKDNRITLISKPNGGAASARNVGLNAAQGTYITMVDADDEITNTALEVLYNAAANSDCDLVITAQSIHNKYGQIITNQFPITGLHKTDPRFLFQNVYRGPVAKLYKRDIIDKYNLRMPENMTIAEDYVFVTSYWTVTKSIYIIPESIYKYIENPNSLIHRFCSKMLSFDAYLKNAEAPWRTFTFLRSTQNNNKCISEWTYELYRDLWKMANNSSRYLTTSYEKRTLRRFVRTCEREMSPHLSLFSKYSMLHRYPKLAQLLIKIRQCLRKGN